MGEVVQIGLSGIGFIFLIPGGGHDLEAKPAQDDLQRHGEFADGNRRAPEVHLEMVQHRLSGLGDHVRLQFVRGVAGRHEIELPEEQVALMRLIEAAYESAEAGRAVAL